MRHILSLIHNTGFYVMSFLLALMAMPISLLPSDRPMRGVFRLWVRLSRAWALFVLRGRFEARGLDRLPQSGPVFLAAKHQSELDVIMIGSLLPQLGAITHEGA